MESTVHLMALTGIAAQMSQLQARAEKELGCLAGPSYSMAAGGVSTGDCC